MIGKDIRDAFFDQIYEMASMDRNIIFISADADAFSLKKFRENLPDQFINVGVAEQNMALVATGLALEGKRVFIYSITSFIAMRCFEQIKVNICSMNLPIAIIGLGSGYSFSYDGPTHHATQDIAIMRTLPEVTIFNPCDEETAKHAANHCCAATSPTYVRIDKGAQKKLYSPDECASGLKEISNGAKIKIISTGYATHIALKIIKNMKVSVDVVDVYKIKQLNKQYLISILSESDAVIVLEENTLAGGLGSMMCELLVDNSINTKLVRLALEDKQELQFGSRDWLISNGGLSDEVIRTTILDLLHGT